MKLGTGHSIAGANVRIWTIAAAGAVALHLAGAALTYASLSDDYDDDGAGALSVEVGAEFLSPKREFVDAKVGPDAEAQQATPQQTAQMAEEKKEVALPKDTPTEPEKADRVVAENPTKEPVEDNPEQQKTPAEASDYQPAVEAMATPSIEAAKEAEKSAAPVQGIGDTLRRAKETWERNLSAHINVRKIYPEDRQDQRERYAGVDIKFAVDRAGHVLSAEIDKSSGDASFDKTALEWLRRAEPLPAPPPGLVGDKGHELILLFEFNAGKKRKSAKS